MDRRRIAVAACVCHFVYRSQRTAIGSLRPGRGSDTASASTASRSLEERRRHVSIETSAADRRHTPTISPPTSNAPGRSSTRRPAAWPRVLGEFGRLPTGGSTHHRSAGGARAPGGRAQPETSPRRSRGSKHHRSACARASAHRRAPRTRCAPLPAASRPSARTTGPSPDPKCGGNGARAQDAHSARPCWELRRSTRPADAHRPAQQDRTRQRGVSQAVRLDAHGTPGLAERHSQAIEERVEPRSSIARPFAAGAVIRQPPEREYSEVLRGHDVGAEPRAPKLDQRRVLPGG